MTKKGKSKKDIADFMGLEPIRVDNFGFECYKDNQSESGDVPVYELKYDTSWDLLMPVIEKVMDQENDSDEAEELKNSIWEGVSEFNKTKTFKGVVSLIGILKK